MTLQSWSSALGHVTGGRDKLVFVNNGLVGGNIERVINQVAEPAKAKGYNVITIPSENQLRTTCPSTIRGVSTCIAAAVFYSSPNEGRGDMWNYNIRTDAAMGRRVDVRLQNNDEEIYVLPFQHSIDWAIANVNGTVDQSSLPSKVRFQ